MVIITAVNMMGRLQYVFVEVVDGDSGFTSGTGLKPVLKNHRRTVSEKKKEVVKG